MLRQLLHITGLDQALEVAKVRVEGQARHLIQHGKAVAIRVAIAAALVIGAALTMVMSLVAGLAALYLWLAPLVGSLEAIGIIAGALVLFGIILGTLAAMVLRKDPSSVSYQTVEDPEASVAESAGRQDPPSVAGLSERAVSSADVEAIFAVAGKFAQLPHTGIESFDNALRALAPKAEEAARDAVVRAANLLRRADRTTMMSILGFAVALGWAVAKTSSRSERQVVSDPKVLFAGD